MEREVTLNEMLEARENRVRVQKMLINQYGCPIISFTMNIPGPVKNSPLIKRGFGEGLCRIQLALQQAGLTVLGTSQIDEPTGPEAMYVVEGSATEVKALCMELEEQDSLGRLFDMDVIAPDGTKLGRSVERACIVCGQHGRGCASRRVHSLGDLRQATQAILKEHFRQSDRIQASTLVTRALLDEVCTTPKPGLVDRANNGSHADMDIFTFTSSAAALMPYWEDCVRIGQDTAREAPEKTFRFLRQRGKTAEREMYRATAGINTHKGAVFTLGILCGAVGRLWKAEAPCRTPEAIAAECARMYGPVYEADRQTAEVQARTAGERFWVQYGLPGIRGEMAEGLPSVIYTALPALRAELKAGNSRNDAGVVALLHLIALGKDTNMVARGGPELAEAAARQTADLLERNPCPDMADIEKLDQLFIRQNLSAGGCADLLAAAWFLYDWSGEPQ